MLFVFITGRYLPNMVKTLFVIIVTVMCTQNGFCMRAYNMKDYCGKTISMTDENIKTAEIYYEHKSRFRDKLFDLKCKLEISGWRSKELALHFTEVDTGSSGTSVLVRQGLVWDTSEPILGLPTEISTTSYLYLNEVFTTNRPRLFIRVKGDAPVDRHRVFKMVVNSFHTGTCKDFEHRCDNGRCIDSSLKCNGFNPCGDQSDCRSSGMSTESWAIMVCISIAGTFLVSFITCKILTHCCSKCGKADTATESPNTWHEITNADRNEPDRNNGDISVTFNLIGSNNILYAPINGPSSGHQDSADNTGNPDSAHVLNDFEQTAPPSYDDVISGESNNELSDDSDIDYDHSDNSLTESNCENTERRHIRRPRRPNRRHSSRYLPRYSQVMRNRDNYGVRGDDDSVTQL